MRITLPRPAAAVLTTGALLAACLLIMWPSLYNQFPLYFSDSAVYISGAPAPGIPPWYPLMARALCRFSLWLPLIVSSILTIFVVWCLIDRWFPLHLTWIMIVITSTLVLTKLPWVNSLLMPDIYGGLSCAAVLALVGRFDLKPRSIFLLAIIFAGLLFQTASLGVISLMLAVSVMWSFAWKTVHSAISIVLASAIVTVFSYNIIRFNDLSPNPSAAVIIFSKFVYSGVAQQYLAQNCERTHFTICDYLSELVPMQGETGQPFLWKDSRGGQSVADLTLGWIDPNREYRKLIIDITLQYPLEIVRSALVDTFTLLLAEGEVLEEYTDQWPFQSLYASDKEAFEKAKQQQSALPQNATNSVAQFTTVGSALLLAIFALVGIHRHIILLTLGTWIANATVHATLVGAFPRYQDKVNWLLPLILLAIIAEWQATTKRNTSNKRGPIVKDGNIGIAKRC
jgi:hypothetical protein